MASSLSHQKPIRIGYVPEHYLLPLHLAASHSSPSDPEKKESSFPFPVELIPFPSGTGHMITSLRANDLDLAIGLTEGWVAGLLNPTAQSLKSQSPGSNSGSGYRIIGTWVQNPLRWSIVTGAGRDDINSVEDLGELVKTRGLKVGVSRLGSGSHVMASVLAKERGWDVFSTRTETAAAGEGGGAGRGAGMKPIILGPFKDLRDGVNKGSADFFMWEHFTTKPYWTSTAEGGKTNTPELKWVGEIYTPWPSWHIVASTHPFSNHFSSTDSTLDALFAAFDGGIHLFHQGGVDLAVKMLGSGEVGCHYTESDTREWMEALKFAERTRGVDRRVMENVVAVLKGAGVIEENVRVGDRDGVVGIEC